MTKVPATILLFLFYAQCLRAQSTDSTHQSPWSYHFQLTVIDQNHSGFKAAYSGTNSFADSVETGATSITTTLFLGRRLWKNAVLYFNPELSGGRGLSYAVGVAGALNGETYRIGDPAGPCAVEIVKDHDLIDWDVWRTTPLGRRRSSESPVGSRLSSAVGRPPRCCSAAH